MATRVDAVKDVVRGWFKDLAYRAGLRVSRLTVPEFLEPLLHRQLDRKGRLVFVQVGGNDGRSFDPIYRFVMRHRDRVSGVIVEPVPEYFRELRKSYRGHPGVTTVNAAIHAHEREMTIYRVDSSRLNSLPSWAKGSASFNLAHLQRLNLSPEAIVAERVPCITLDELVETHLPTGAAAELDLLQVDTEGYDAEIIRTIDFDRVSPAIIRFEHGVGQGMLDREAFRTLLDILHRQGYACAVERLDVTAYRPEILVG